MERTINQKRIVEILVAFTYNSDRYFCHVDPGTLFNADTSNATCHPVHDESQQDFVHDDDESVTQIEYKDSDDFSHSFTYSSKQKEIKHGKAEERDVVEEEAHAKHLITNQNIHEQEDPFWLWGPDEDEQPTTVQSTTVQSTTVQPTTVQPTTVQPTTVQSTEFPDFLAEAEKI